MTLRDEFYKQETDVCFVYLLEVSHPDLANPLRFTNNNESLTSNGNLYQSWPFEVELPDQGEDKIPRARLVFDAVDNSITTVLRGLSEAPSLVISIVAVDTPNVIEKSFSNLTVTSQAYTIDYKTQLVLGMFPISRERAQNIRFDKVRFPGLFPK
jgi:hypothetical protein